MRPGATSSIWNQNGNRWRGVHRIPRDKKKKSRLQKSNVKTLLIAFFYNKSIILKEFVPADQTINATFYQTVLNKLLQHIRQVWPELHRTGKWMLLLENAPAHSAIHVRQFLAQKMVAVLDHPRYSPDLAPADFFLFPHLKAVIKVARFADVHSIRDRVTDVLRSIPQEAFAECLRKLYECCQTCVDSGWRLFWRTIKKICLYLLFYLFSDRLRRTF